MIQGGCLCGAVRFELSCVIGPFELCHCSRCRTVSGSAFMAAVAVRRSDFRWLHGTEHIRIYDAPIVREPPAYRSCFCQRCGCPVPDPTNDAEIFEIAAGSLKGELGVQPDKHIFVEHKAGWFSITDPLPQLDEGALNRLRAGRAH